MNKNTVITIFIIIILLILGFVFWGSSDKSKNEMTPTQALDQQTQADTTTEIDASLDSINPDSSSPEDTQKMDSDIKSL